VTALARTAHKTRRGSPSAACATTAPESLRSQPESRTPWQGRDRAARPPCTRTHRPRSCKPLQPDSFSRGRCSSATPSTSRCRDLAPSIVAPCSGLRRQSSRGGSEGPARNRRRPAFVCGPFKPVHRDVEIAEGEKRKGRRPLLSLPLGEKGARFAALAAKWEVRAAAPLRSHPSMADAKRRRSGAAAPEAERGAVPSLPKQRQWRCLGPFSPGGREKKRAASLPEGEKRKERRPLLSLPLGEKGPVSLPWQRNGK